MKHPLGLKNAFKISNEILWKNSKWLIGLIAQLFLSLLIAFGFKYLNLSLVDLKEVFLIGIGLSLIYLILVVTYVPKYDEFFSKDDSSQYNLADYFLSYAIVNVIINLTFFASFAILKLVNTNYANLIVIFSFIWSLFNTMVSIHNLAKTIFLLRKKN